MTISAPGTIPPFISLTVPCKVPVTVCAVTGTEHNNVTVAKAKHKVATPYARAVFDTILSSYLDTPVKGVTQKRGRYPHPLRCGQCDSPYWRKCSKELLVAA